MNKTYLLQTSGKLHGFSDKASEEYIKKSDKLLSEMKAIMLKRDDIKNLIGEENLLMMQDNHANHIRFIASILKEFNAEVLVETILWVFRAYRSHGFTTNYWAAQLNAWIEVIKKVLSEESSSEILPLYNWMQINIPIFVKLSDDKLENLSN